MSDLLIARLKHIIVEALQRDTATPEDIADDEPLLGSPPLRLDSNDMPVLVSCFEKEFGIRFREGEESRRALASVRALAVYIRSHHTLA